MLLFPKHINMLSDVEHYLQNHLLNCVKGKENMKVLIPVINQTDVFHDNLFRAPSFAEYIINTYNNIDYFCSLNETFTNPFSYVATNDQTLCNNRGICDIDNCTVQHLKEHYTLSKSLKSCDYILTDYSCETMREALKLEGINVYHISPFLHSTDIAIKNFLLGVPIASTLQHIHFES